jgi:glycosyltransferase involved in cell wall biosynthesis
MISLIIPFYKKLKEFQLVFPHNSKLLQEFEHEIIIVMDHDESEKELIDFIKSQNHNFRIIINRHKHAWRPPCKALNVGIRHAKGDKVVVISPESAFESNLLKRLVEASDNNIFAVGGLKYADLSWIKPNITIDDISSNIEFRYNLYYGSICASRSLFEKVRGYDESLVHWGGDDDNLRARFMLAGAKKTILEESYIVHFQENFDGNVKRTHPARIYDMSYYDRICNPTQIQVNNKGWGVDFNEIIYDWVIK